MNANRFFNIQRQIFGICPTSGCFFRLSDCRVFQKKRPVHDWMDKLDEEESKLDEAEQRLDDKEQEMRERAREKGRALARLAVKKIDPIFTPRNLNPDDAKVLFHPVDYVVFHGMKAGGSISRIVLMDAESPSKDHRALQESIRKVISRGNYEWLTLRVHEDGTIKAK